jgi:Spermidine/putrescine-binding periplasmic protein
MGNMKHLLGGLVAVLLLAGGAAFAADPPEKANIDWKQFQGKELNVFFVKHPWESAIEPLLPDFEKLTGIKLNVTTASEEAFWNKSSLGLASTKPPFDVSSSRWASMATPPIPTTGSPSSTARSTIRS